MALAAHTQVREGIVRPFVRLKGGVKGRPVATYLV